MIFGHNPFRIFHYYFYLTFKKKKSNLKYGPKKLNVEYTLMQYCPEEKNEDNGSLRHNNI